MEAKQSQQKTIDFGWITFTIKGDPSGEVSAQIVGINGATTIVKAETKRKALSEALRKFAQSIEDK